MAVAAALLLISRSGGSDDESFGLKGSTTRGEPVSLNVVDGRVEAFAVRVGASCPEQRVWHGWEWSARGPLGGEEENFQYVDRHGFPDGGKFVSTMRGRLIDGGERARGTIETTGTWPGKDGPTPCRSSLAFEAAKAG